MVRGNGFEYTNSLLVNCAQANENQSDEDALQRKLENSNENVMGLTLICLAVHL